MKVMTPGSLIGWAHLSARGSRRPNWTSGAGDGRIRQAEQAGLTDRVGPPISEGEAMAESDKQRRPNRTSGATAESDK
jgi:hypothetical protein